MLLAVQPVESQLHSLCLIRTRISDASVVIMVLSHCEGRVTHLTRFEGLIILQNLKSAVFCSTTSFMNGGCDINLLKPTGYVMHQQV